MVALITKVILEDQITILVCIHAPYTDQVRLVEDTLTNLRKFQEGSLIF